MVPLQQEPPRLWGAVFPYQPRGEVGQLVGDAPGVVHTTQGQDGTRVVMPVVACTDVGQKCVSAYSRNVTWVACVWSLVELHVVLFGKIWKPLLPSHFGLFEGS